MAKMLLIQVRLDNDDEADDAALFDCDELINLLTGISGGQVAGRVAGVLSAGITDPADPPVVAEVVEGVAERAYTNITNVGALRRFLDGIPDSAALESYSGSVESLVNFGLSYGESSDEYNDYSDELVVTIHNEN